MQTRRVGALGAARLRRACTAAARCARPQRAARAVFLFCQNMIKGFFPEQWCRQETFTRTVVPHALFCVTFRTVVPQLQNGGTAQLLTIQNGGTALNFCPEWYIIRKRRTRDVFRTVVPHALFSLFVQNGGTAAHSCFRTVVTRVSTGAVRRGMLHTRLRPERETDADAGGGHDHTCTRWEIHISFCT